MNRDTSNLKKNKTKKTNNVFGHGLFRKRPLLPHRHIYVVNRPSCDFLWVGTGQGHIQTLSLPTLAPLWDSLQQIEQQTFSGTSLLRVYEPIWTRLFKCFYTTSVQLSWRNFGLQPLVKLICKKGCIDNTMLYWH